MEWASGDFHGIMARPGPPCSIPREAPVQPLRVIGYDMAYLDIGEGPPLVCVHGSLCDFRIWSAVLGPLTQNHRVIAVSLRHFFPDHWDGVGDSYSIAQHVDDVIAFVEKLDTKPVDLMGHSRGAHTRGTLPQVLHALAANVAGSKTEMIPGTTHPMFEQAPQKYCEIVLEFLAG